MAPHTDDLRIRKLDELVTPAAIIGELPCDDAISQTVSEARGALLLAAKRAGVPVFEYTPLQVKQSVAGYGKATKKQVQEMTRTLLKLDTVPKPDDTADALAMAICHAHSSRSLQFGMNVTKRQSMGYF